MTPKSKKIFPYLTNFAQKFLLRGAATSPAPTTLHLYVIFSLKQTVLKKLQKSVFSISQILACAEPADRVAPSSYVC